MAALSCPTLSATCTATLGRRRLSAPRIQRQLPCVVRAGSSFTDDFNRSAKDAQKKLEDWAREQRLQQRLKDATQAAKGAFETTVDTARSKARELDEEWELRAKAKQAAERVETAARDADARFSIRRRVREAYQDVRRKAPVWQRQASEFFSTPLGTVAGILLVTLLIASGAFWRLLNAFFLLMWLAPVAMVPFAAFLNYKAAEEMRRQQEAVYQEEMRRRQNPFGSSMEDLFSAFGGRAAAGGGQGRARGQSAGAGPVIDVDWKTVDD